MSRIRYPKNVFVFTVICNQPPVPLLSYTVLSYRPTPTESLHIINPICALLIISRKKTARIHCGFGPFHFPVHFIPAKGGRMTQESRSSSAPSVPLCGTETALHRIAQFRNEDRIKISPETVRSAAIHTNNITSETVLHRITRVIPLRNQNSTAANKHPV